MCFLQAYEGCEIKELEVENIQEREGRANNDNFNSSMFQTQVYTVKHINLWNRKLITVGCSKHQLHNKVSKRIYPGTIRPLSNLTRTESQALNATQGHKHSYQNPAANTVFYQDGIPGSKCHTGTKV